jgi:hypothetical protein
VPGSNAASIRIVRERFEKEKYCFTRTTHQKWAGIAQKTGIEADVINAINSISPSSSWDCSAPALACGGAFFICAKVPAPWRCSPQCAVFMNLT